MTGRQVSKNHQAAVLHHRTRGEARRARTYLPREKWEEIARFYVWRFDRRELERDSVSLRRLLDLRRVSKTFDLVLKEYIFRDLVWREYPNAWRVPTSEISRHQWRTRFTRKAVALCLHSHLIKHVRNIEIWSELRDPRGTQRSDHRLWSPLATQTNTMAALATASGIVVPAHTVSLASSSAHIDNVKNPYALVALIVAIAFNLDGMVHYEQPHNESDTIRSILALPGKRPLRKLWFMTGSPQQDPHLFDKWQFVLPTVQDLQMRLVVLRSVVPLRPSPNLSHLEVTTVSGGSSSRLLADLVNQSPALRTLNVDISQYLTQPQINTAAPWILDLIATISAPAKSRLQHVRFWHPLSTPGMDVAPFPGPARYVNFASWTSLETLGATKSMIFRAPYYNPLPAKHVLSALPQSLKSLRIISSAAHGPRVAALFAPLQGAGPQGEEHGLRLERGAMRNNDQALRDFALSNTHDLNFVAMNRSVCLLAAKANARVRKNAAYDRAVGDHRRPTETEWSMQPLGYVYVKPGYEPSEKEQADRRAVEEMSTLKRLYEEWPVLDPDTWLDDGQWTKRPKPPANR